MTRARRMGWGVIGAIVAGVTFTGGWMLLMPGRSFRGALPPLTTEEQAVAGGLRRHVDTLARVIGARNVDHPAQLAAAADYLERELQHAGHRVERQGFVTDGVKCDNLVVELRGRARPDEIVVVGAHYDSVADCPGANDNASGSAALVELARLHAAATPARTVRFVLFANEEPPHFQTESMGSLVYARACHARGERVAAMLSLETIAYYSDDKGSQQYPFPFSLFYPDTGDFIGFIGNVGSRSLVRRALGAFRAGASFPSEGAAVPGAISGVGWSDHWSFWQVGYPAVMVTDTAPFRYPHYHLPSDTPEKLDYDRAARVTVGMRAVLADLTR